MEYKTPWMAALGLLFYIAWLFDFFKGWQTAQIHFPRPAVIKRKIILKIIIFLLGTASIGFLSYSLMSPRKPAGVIERDIEANDIFFVLDLSHSMKANDFSPSRLAVAKQKILEFISLRPTDRIGLIVFAQKVFTLLPLTRDMKLIEQTIRDEFDLGFIGSGTNIGDALALGVARAAHSFAKKKMLILLTDGASNVGHVSPLEAAEEAKKKGIKVYSIGIGSNRKALIPNIDSFGRKRMTSIPGKGFDYSTLTAIAKTTGGKSFLANDSKALKNVFQEINQLEKSKIKSAPQLVYQDLYRWYFLVGIILFLLTDLFRMLILRSNL